MSTEPQEIREPTLEDLKEAFQRELSGVAERGTAPLLESGHVSEDLRSKIREQTRLSVAKAAGAYAAALHPFLKTYLDARFSTLSESIQEVLTTQVSAIVAQVPLGPGTIVTASVSITQSVTNTLVSSSTMTVTQESTPTDLVLWRWNKTDVSQFDTTTVITSSNSHTATMNFRASCPGEHGPSIVISASWTGTTLGFVAFRLNPSEGLNLPSRFVMFMRQNRTNMYPLPTKDETISVGPFYHNGSWSQGGIYGFGATFGQFGVEGVRCEGSGALALSRPFEEGPNVGGPQNKLIYEGVTEARTFHHEAHIKHPVSASTPPLHTLNFYNMVRGSSGTSEAVRQIKYQDALLWDPPASETEPNSQWYLQRCDQFGLVARRQTETNGSIDAVIEISDIIISKHPTDW